LKYFNFLRTNNNTLIIKMSEHIHPVKERRVVLGDFEPIVDEYLPKSLQPLPILERSLPVARSEEQVKQNLEKLKLLKGRYGLERQKIFEWIKNSIAEFNFRAAMELQAREDRHENLSSQYNALSLQEENLNDVYGIKLENFPLLNACVGNLNTGFRIGKDHISQTTMLNDPKWKILKARIGDASTFGQAQMGCLVKEDGQEVCNYVIKLMNIDKGAPTTIDYLGKVGIYKLNMIAVLNEVNIQIKASLYGLGPKIYDVFYCKSFATDDANEFIQTVPNKDVRGLIRREIVDGKEQLFLGHNRIYNCKESGKTKKIICFVPTRVVYIVMESLDLTVTKFREVVGNQYNSFIKGKVIELFNRLHDIGILHGDAHSSNIMFNLTEEGKKAYISYERKKPFSIPDRNGDFYGSLQSLMFIDFGKSVDFIQDNIPITDDLLRSDIRRFE
jgi:hypothetical protein